MRRLIAPMLALVILAIVAPTASAAVTKIGYWRTIDSNTTKTYTFDWTGGNACSTNSRLTLKMEVRLGNVYSTSVRINSIKYTWTLLSGSYIYNDSSDIYDNFGGVVNSAPLGINGRVPQYGRTWTHYLPVGATFRFTTTSQVIIDKTDLWPDVLQNYCSQRSVLQAVYRASPL